MVFVLVLVVFGVLVMVVEFMVVNFGGVNGDVQKVVFNQLFEKVIGNKVMVVEYNGEQVKVKVMVEVKYVNWDVVEVELGDLNCGCDEGLYEKFDWLKIVKKFDLILEVLQVCGVGFFVWLIVLLYNVDKLKIVLMGWVDFWNVKKFFGKCGMCKGVCYNFEFVLMVDGVVMKDVYKVFGMKVGQDCVFKKFDELKLYIQWWEVGVQLLQFFVVGDVVMLIVYNGCIDVVQKEGKNLKVVWNGSIYDFDYWVILKGLLNKVLVEQYIVYLLMLKLQQVYVQYIVYGLMNVVVIKVFDVKMFVNLLNLLVNGKNVVFEDIGFWIDYSDEFEQCFVVWVMK